MSRSETPADPSPAAVDSHGGLRPRVLGIAIWAVARFIGATLRIRYENLEQFNAVTSSGRGAILVTWHGRTLVAAHVLRKRGYWALISHSRDGAIQDVIFRRFGFQTVRGSTSRGGVRAVLQLARKIQEGGILAFTPDGPRGPTHQVQQGTIFLAQRSGCPIVPVGIAARPRLLVNSWDRYMIPAPFARATFVVGSPMLVPADADDAARQQAACALADAMNACEKQAEEMLGLPYAVPGAP